MGRGFFGVVPCVATFVRWAVATFGVNHQIFIYIKYQSIFSCRFSEEEITSSHSRVRVIHQINKIMILNIMVELFWKQKQKSRQKKVTVRIFDSYYSFFF